MGGEVHDAEERIPYPPEFRQRIIELVRKGRTPESPAEQSRPSAQTIRNWLGRIPRVWALA
jgi:transposase